MNNFVPTEAQNHEIYNTFSFKYGSMVVQQGTGITYIKSYVHHWNINSKEISSKTYLQSFGSPFIMLTHVHRFSHAISTIQVTLKYLHESESHKMNYRMLREKRGVPQEVHMIMVPSPFWGRAELGWTHRATQQDWPQPFFPTSRDKFNRSCGTSRGFLIPHC